MTLEIEQVSAVIYHQFDRYIILRHHLKGSLKYGAGFHSQFQLCNGNINIRSFYIEFSSGVLFYDPFHLVLLAFVIILLKLMYFSCN